MTNFAVFQSPSKYRFLGSLTALMASIVICSCFLMLAAASLVLGQEVKQTHVDVIFEFETTDGTKLEAKLSLPAGRTGRMPVVFYLHGAGPRTYNHMLPYRNRAGKLQYESYYEMHARELARRGIAFCRMNKRGCYVKNTAPFKHINLAEFGKATMDVQLADYVSCLEALCKRQDIDPRRIALWGSSEGTRLGPLLAARRPAGIKGLVLAAYSADNAKDTLVWQNSKGPFRNVQALFDEARDGKLTKKEWDAILKTRPKSKAILAFDSIAGDDNEMTEDDFEPILKPRIDAILEAVDQGNDELLQKVLLGLSAAYFKSWWNAEHNSENLLKLDVPIAILHGQLDGTCRVEGVSETQAAFAKAGKNNLTVHIYPMLDHNLGWTRKAAATGGSKPFRDAFAFAATILSVDE